MPHSNISMFTGVRLKTGSLWDEEENAHFSGRLGTILHNLKTPLFSFSGSISVSFFVLFVFIFLINDILLLRFVCIFFLLLSDLWWTFWYAAHLFEVYSRFPFMSSGSLVALWQRQNGWSPDQKNWNCPRKHLKTPVWGQVSI